MGAGVQRRVPHGVVAASGRASVGPRRRPPAQALGARRRGPAWAFGTRRRRGELPRVVEAASSRASIFLLFYPFKKITFRPLGKVNSTLDPEGRRHDSWRRGYTLSSFVTLFEAADDLADSSAP
jgi:hypothetical protein